MRKEKSVKELLSLSTVWQYLAFEFAYLVLKVIEIFSVIINYLTKILKLEKKSML